MNTAYDAVVTIESYLIDIHNADAKQATFETVLLEPQFKIAPASQAKHHAYTGGLAVHTAEVLKGCWAMRSIQKTDTDVLLTAAIWHDFMKIRDYEKNVVDGLVVCDEAHPHGWRYSDYARKIRHIAGSYGAWVEVAKRYHLKQGFTDEVGHCLLAHHGRPDWGSPVEPQSPEALILHSADILSAFYGPGKVQP